MKFILKNGDKEMSLEVAESSIKGDVFSFIVGLYEELFAEPVPMKVNTFKENNETLAERYGYASEKPPVKKDVFTIRQRIPNNVVDISKLNIKQAVTESALVRCPKCGQSHAIVLINGNSLYLMSRSYSTNEFGIVCEIPINDNIVFDPVCVTSDTPEAKLAYFRELQDLDFMENKDFNVNNDTEIFCPVCHKSSSFYEWKDAYENKEKYFEYQYVCGICGGECVMDAKEEKESGETVICVECGHKWLKEQV